MEDSAISPAPWFINTSSARTTASSVTIAVAHSDFLNTAYNGSNYLAISMPGSPTATFLYLEIPISVTTSIRYLISFFAHSQTAGVVNLNPRLLVANDVFSKTQNLVSSNSFVAGATWSAKSNIRFQGQGWETKSVFVFTRSIQTPDVPGQYFIDDLVMSEYGPQNSTNAQRK